MLVFDFADPDGLNKTEIEECARCPIVELFDKQRSADRAKKWLKQDFEKALAVYFCQFQTHSGFDFKKLKAKLDSSEKVFLRHLGKDKVLYLRLLISFAEALAEPAPKPRGLLFEAAV
jgi:hypothetical protein